MAIDARHHNFLLPQLISNRELYYPNQGSVFPAYNDGRTGGSLGVPLVMTTAPDGVSPACHQHSLVCELLQPKTSMNTESGLTCNVSAPRKRSRDCFDVNPLPAMTFSKNNAFSQYPLGLDIVSPLQQYQLEIDTIISQHTKKMRTEIEDRQKQNARLIMQAIGEGMMKKLNEKDEQITKVEKLNMILQERVKSLFVENQLWRDLAQTNEATANTLRTNLEQVLAHVSYERFSAGGTSGAVEEDVQSCCGSCSSTDYGKEQEAKEVVGRRRSLAREAHGGGGGNSHMNSSSNSGGGGSRMCRACGVRESRVLLLPCRHLCLCTLCGSSLLQTCPVCNSNMNATVHVNMSSS